MKRGMALGLPERIVALLLNFPRFPRRGLYMCRPRSRSRLFLVLCAGALGFVHFVVLPNASGGYNDPCHPPPEERRALRHLARGVLSALEELNQTYWIDHGTLLGAVRGGDVLPHDYDVDIGRLHSDDYPGIGQDFQKDLKRWNITGNLALASYNLHKKRFTCDMARFDVITRNTSRGHVEYLQEYHRRRESSFHRLKYVVSETVFPKDLFLPTVRVPFLGLMVQAPRRYMELLKRRYPYTWGWTFPYKWKCWVPFFG